MGILERVFGSRKNRTAAPYPVREKQYDFSVMEIEAVGEVYNYRVKGKNKEEAFRKLFMYFKNNHHHKEIDSDHNIVVQPQKSVFRVMGMPTWFWRYLCGHPTDEDRKKYNEDARKNGIECD